MQQMAKGFLIAAPTSGSGKTTIARGLMSLFTAKGYRVQPFKCGPDYIDTKFHAAVCGRPSINLDTFMASAEHVRELYGRYDSAADVCVVEGMMGLFDGYDRDAGSSAEIARVLGLPIVLVVDAKSAAYSMAALISGFVNFRDDVHIAGVIFNRVGSPRHFAMLQQVCDDLNVECFGYLPKDAALEQGSRYLGLDFSRTPENERLVELLEKNVRWQRILEITMHNAQCRINNAECNENHTTQRTLIARNAESFSFIYQENIDSLDNVAFFDPETDVPCLDDVALLCNQVLCRARRAHHSRMRWHDVSVRQDCHRRGRVSHVRCASLRDYRPKDRPQTIARLSSFHARRQGVSRPRVPLHPISGYSAPIGGTSV